LDQPIRKIDSPYLLSGIDVAACEEGDLGESVILVLIENANWQNIWLTRVVKEPGHIAIVVGVDAVPVVQVEVVAVIGAPIGLHGGENLTRVAGHKGALGHIGQRPDSPAFGLLLALDDLQRSPRAILHHAVLAGELWQQ